MHQIWFFIEWDYTNKTNYNICSSGFKKKYNCGQRKIELHFAAIHRIICDCVWEMRIIAFVRLRDRVIKEIEFIVGRIDGVRLSVRRYPVKTPILKSFLIICQKCVYFFRYIPLIGINLGLVHLYDHAHARVRLTAWISLFSTVAIVNVISLCPFYNLNKTKQKKTAIYSL